MKNILWLWLVLCKLTLRQTSNSRVFNKFNRQYLFKNQFIFFILISPGKQQQHKHPLFLLETFAWAAQKKKRYKKKFWNSCTSGNFKQLSDRNLNNRRTKNKRLLTPEIIIHAITWEIKACKSSTGTSGQKCLFVNSACNPFKSWFQWQRKHENAFNWPRVETRTVR